MDKLGVMVEALGSSQPNLLITRTLNLMATAGDLFCPIVFYSSYGQPPVWPQFTMLQDVEIFGYEGILIANDLSTAQKVVNAPRAKRKLLYMWDLEWQYNPNIKFKDLRGVYLHPELELIASTEEYAKIIEQCWKKPIAIVEEFDHDKLVRLLS